MGVTTGNIGDFTGAGTAIAGIAGALATMGASRRNLKAQRETNEANLKLAQLQNSWNVQQWNREMEYNSPANKVKLLQQAGLNPLFYEGGLQPTETQAPKSAELANQVAPQVDAAAIGNSFSNLTNSLFEATQYQIMKKELEIKEAELKNTQRRTDQDIAESQQRVENLVAEKNLTEKKAEEVIANTDLIRAKIEETNVQKEREALSLKQERELYDTVVEQAMQTLKITKLEAQKLVKEIDFIVANTGKVESEKALIDIQVQYGDLGAIAGLIGQFVGIVGKLFSNKGLGKLLKWLR